MESNIFSLKEQSQGLKYKWAGRPLWTDNSFASAVKLNIYTLDRQQFENMWTVRKPPPKPP